MTVVRAQPWDEGSGPNLVDNPGFEQLTDDGRPAHWSAPEPVYSLTEEPVRGGEHSLQYVNDNPERYLLCDQQVDLEPGRRYDVRAWVRTEDVQGEDTGATVCLEWNDAAGDYLGGYYPPGEKGDTAEWTQVGGISRRVPEEAASIRVICYVRKEMTGTAWWDDVSVRLVREQPLKTLLLRPNYRGWVTDEGPDAVEVRAELTLDDVEVPERDLALHLSLVPAEGGEALASAQVDDVRLPQTDLQLPLPELQPGDYIARTELVREDTGAAIARDEWPVVRRTGEEPTSYIDEHNRLIVEGEPFFPLGMYWGSVSDEQLQTYTEAPFNCLMPYGRPDEQGLDLIDSYGLKCLYSIKDFYAGTKWAPTGIQTVEDEEPAVREILRQYRDHPALLGWYINDERPLSMVDRLEAHQQWVEEEDPNHPTWVVLYQVHDVAGYVRTFDVIGTDPYPIPGRPAAMAGQWAELTREAVGDARPIWMVPQVHNWGVYRGYDGTRPPTLEEMRSMTWQCICEGADGLVYYSWMDLHRDETTPFEERWPDVKTVTEEVAEQIPVLLSVEPTPEVEVRGPEAVHWTIRTHDGTNWLFLVNGAPEPARAIVRPGGKLSDVRGEGLSVRQAGRTFDLKPLEVRIEKWAG
ncbi:MAG: hypothetical protein GF393_11195 [Armatimonadia bacterium]|nr:hypothetical protein [Armatimonadia bacterium]